MGLAGEGEACGRRPSSGSTACSAPGSRLFRNRSASRAHTGSRSAPGYPWGDGHSGNGDRMSGTSSADGRFACRTSGLLFARISGIFLYPIIKKLILMAKSSHKSNFLTPLIFHYAALFDFRDVPIQYSSPISNFLLWQKNLLH